MVNGGQGTYDCCWGGLPPLSMRVADSCCEKHLDLQTTIVRTYANVLDRKEVTIDRYPGLTTGVGMHASCIRIRYSS